MFFLTLLKLLLFDGKLTLQSIDLNLGIFLDNKEFVFGLHWYNSLLFFFLLDWVKFFLTVFHFVLK